MYNFLLSNGEFLLAHCSTKLAWITREAPFAEAHLKDQELSIDFSSVTTTSDRVTVIATNPLTENEKWTILDPGTLVLFEEGSLSRSWETIPGPEKKEDN